MVRCNFASNLFGDTVIMTAPRLRELLEKCPTQKVRANLPQYEYPEELLSVSTMQTIASGDVDFRVKRAEAVNVRKLDSVGLFGEHWLISPEKTEEKTRAKEQAKENMNTRIREKHGRKDDIPRSYKIYLSDRERMIVERLRRKDKK